MRVLCLSHRGDLIPVCERLRSESHDARIVIDDPAFHCRVAGRVPQVSIGTLRGGLMEPRVREVLREVAPDLVLADDGMGDVADAFKAHGAQVWGASRWGEQATSLPDYSAKLMSTFEIIPVKQKAKQVILSVGAWWDGLAMQNTHMMSEEMGFMHGGGGAQVVSACVVRPVPEWSGVVQKSLAPMVAMLRKTGYHGPVSVSDALHIGFSLHSFAALAEIIPGEIGPSLMGAGKKLANSWGIAVRVSVPPFPIHPAEVRQGQQIALSIEDAALKHVWLLDATPTCTIGTTGDVGWVSAWGGDLDECRKRVARTIRRVAEATPELQFRSDAGLMSQGVMSKMAHSS